MPRSDDEDSYEPSPAQSRKERVVTNMPYDEALELSQESEASSLADAKSPAARGAGAKGSGAKASGRTAGGRGHEVMTNNPFDEAEDLDDEEDSVSTSEGLPPRSFAKPEPSRAEAKPSQGAKPTPTPQPAARPAAPASTGRMSAASDESSGDDDEDEEETSGRAPTSAPKPEGAYDASAYADLNVSADVRDLFQYIGRYNAHEVELDSTLKCFVPDYIPAVGEMDAFIKVPRPDGEPDALGLQVLDEPAAAQSDATVLELQLRAVSKKQHGDVAVRSIEHAAKNPQEIDRWIRSIEDLHRSKPPPTVNYRKAMPDIDQLMEEWPAEFEELLKTTPLPDAQIDLTLSEYARVACALLDIPVYDNLVESLHVLFSVYLEFADNVHFQRAQAGAGAGAAPDGPDMVGGAEVKAMD